MSFIFDKQAIKRNCEEFFDLYAVKDELVQRMCSRKITHTRDVAKNSLYLAEALHFNEYDETLAWVIGYLHDFARFGQAIITHTFKDSDRYNHAHIGAKLLFRYGMIEDIIGNYKDINAEDKIVMEKAVYHHGDLELPPDLTPREKLFCEIIRDADKIDIFKTIVTTGYEVMYGANREEVAKTDISPEIEEAFYNRKTVDYKKRKTLADFLLAHQALFFGLKLKAAKQKAIEDGFLQQLTEIEFANPKTEEKYFRMKKYLYEE